MCSKCHSRQTLTRAVLGQVLVFALFLLSKRAAGLAALFGLAFTRRPPVMQTEVSVSGPASCTTSAQDADGGRLPFLELWGGDESGEVSSTALHSALPPVGILLVDDLNDVTGLKLEAGFFAWDEVILGRVVVKLGPHIHLLVKRTYGVSYFEGDSV